MPRSRGTRILPPSKPRPLTASSKAAKTTTVQSSGKVTEFHGTPSVAPSLSSVRAAPKRFTGVKVPGGIISSSKAVKVGGKAFTPQQAKVLKKLKTASSKSGSRYDRGFGPSETVPPKVAAAVAEKEGLPGVTYAQIAKGESALRPGVPNPDDATPSLFQMTPSVQSAATVSKWNKIASEHPGGYTNPIVAAKQAKVLAGSGTGVSNYYGTGFVTNPDAHLPGGKAQAQRILGSPKATKKVKALSQKAKKLGVKKPQKAAGVTKAAPTKARYANPYPAGGASRTDMGQDWTNARQGAPIKAIGHGTVVSTGGGGFPSEGGSGGGVLLKLDKPPTGANTSPYVYYYEGVAPVVKAGQRVKRGQAVARSQGSSVEIGFADSSGTTIAHDVYSEGDVTAAGVAFKRLTRAPSTSSGATAGTTSYGASGFTSAGPGAVSLTPTQVKTVKKLQKQGLGPKQILAKLRSLGVGTSTAPSSSSTPDVSLAALERKYGGV